MDFPNLLLCLLSIKPISVVPVCIAYITYSHMRTFSIGKGGIRTSTMSEIFLFLRVLEKKFSTLGWIRSFLEPRRWFLILKNNWNTSNWAEAKYSRQTEDTELEAEKRKQKLMEEASWVPWLSRDPHRETVEGICSWMPYLGDGTLYWYITESWLRSRIWP